MLIIHQLTIKNLEERGSIPRERSNASDAFLKRRNVSVQVFYSKQKETLRIMKLREKNPKNCWSFNRFELLQNWRFHHPSGRNPNFWNIGLNCQLLADCLNLVHMLVAVPQHSSEAAPVPLPLPSATCSCCSCRGIDVRRSVDELRAGCCRFGKKTSA